MPSSALDDNLPMIGENVIWYSGADKNQPPTVCTVTHIHPSGALRMAVVSVNGGSLYGPAAIRENVFHVDSDEVRLRPNVAREIGAWDSIQNHETRRRDRFVNDRRQKQKDMGIAQAAPVDPEIKLRDQVRNLLAAGKTTGEMAQITRQKKDKIEEIVTFLSNPATV